MGDKNSGVPPASNTTNRLESFHPECTDLKQQYDQCFNTWFTEHYMNGHYNNNICRNLFQTYTDCVKEQIKRKLTRESESRIMSDTPINSTAEEEDHHIIDMDSSLDIELEKLKKLKKEKDEIMKALHKYNDIKDAAQIVLGRLAIIEGVTVAEIHRNYNLLESD